MHWHYGGGRRRLRQQLELVVGRLANPVERHQGLLHGPRCRLHEDQGMSATVGVLSADSLPGGYQHPSQDYHEQDNGCARFRVHRDFYP